MFSSLRNLLAPFLVPIPSDTSRFHYFTDPSIIVFTVASLSSLFLAGLTAVGWISTERRRVWFLAEIERRRAFIQEAENEHRHQIEVVQGEMERLAGRPIDFSRQKETSSES